TSLSICTSIFISRVFISLSPTSSSLGTFSFNPFADHPPLPSFPTRRSSDLAKLARHVPADAPKHHRVHAFLNITQRLQRDGALFRGEAGILRGHDENTRPGVANRDRRAAQEMIEARHAGDFDFASIAPSGDLPGALVAD